ncbi:MAG TPA: GDP-mannose 4,6-dehydratase, partial [Actinomycetota bacterium]|nr:GDP-mannose 4,6-dehydratase [Actinomycetota bacterium]
DLIVHGDGSQTRCFGYVLDVIPALIDLMACREAEGLAVNLGSVEEISIRDLAQLVTEVTGSRSEVKLVPYGAVYEAGFEDMPRRVPDISRARKLLGFEPTTTLREIIEAMVEDIRSR